MAFAVYGQILIGIVFVIKEILMLAYTIYMFRVRRDICQKPTILLFLLCLNASNIMKGICTLLILTHNEKIANTLSDLTAMLRDSMMLLVVQRLLYMLELGNVCSRLVRGIVIAINVLNNVVFFILWLMHIIEWENMGDAIVTYVTSGEIAIAGLYVIVGLIFWIVFRRMLAGAFKLALILVLLAHFFRIGNNFYIGNKSTKHPNITLAIAILVNLIFFIALLHFLNVIIYTPETKPSNPRKKTARLFSSEVRATLLTVN